MSAEMGGTLYQETDCAHVIVRLADGSDRNFNDVNVAIIAGGYLRIWRPEVFDTIFNASEWSEIST